MASKELAKLKAKEAALKAQYIFVVSPLNPNEQGGSWVLRFARKPGGSSQWTEIGTKKGSKAEVTQFAANKRSEILRRGVPDSNVKLKVMG